MNSINLNGSGSFAYRPVKQEVMVNCSPSPNEAFTSSRIRVYCSKGTQSLPIQYVIQWKRVNGGIEQSLENSQGSCYECSPLDVGAIIEARIKYEDEGHHYETTRRFGPIRLDVELSTFERSNRNQSFRIKVILENTIVDLNLNFMDDCIVLASREGLEYRIKVTSTLEISLKPDTRLVYWKIKLHQEALTGYFSTMLRKSIKQKIQALEMIFQSRQKRDIFLLLLRNFSRRKSNSKGKSNFLTVKEEPASMGYNREKELNLSAQAAKSRKNSDNSTVPQSKRQRLPVEKDKLITKERLPATKAPIGSLHNSSNNISASLKSDCLNIFDEEDANFIRQFQNKDVSTDLPSKRQHALNLRQSFVELEQRHMNTKSRKDLKIVQNEDNSKQIKELRQHLEEARGQIIKLHSEISELREENISLKQMLNTSGNTKDVVQLRQKIQYLTADNQRLESERTQIIADKITTQRKYQKEKQQKQVFKSKLLGIGINITALFSSSKPQLVVPSLFKEGIERKNSRSPMQTIDPSKIQSSHSNKEIKHRKDSNAKTSIGFSNYSPESPSHTWQPLSRRVESEQQPSSYYG